MFENYFIEKYSKKLLLEITSSEYLSNYFSIENMSILFQISKVYSKCIIWWNHENLVCRRSEIYRKIGHVPQLGLWKMVVGSKGGETTALGVMDGVSWELNRWQGPNEKITNVVTQRYTYR